MYLLADNLTVLEFPYSVNNLRRDNRNTSFTEPMTDEDLAEWGVFPVVDTVAPGFDPESEALEISTPIFSNGTWYQTWLVRKLDQDEISTAFARCCEQARIERNQLLADSDWTQVADAPVNKEEWKAYRQNLRDITNQDDFPWSIAWPSLPED